MKKEYIMPSIEIIKSQLNYELMDHSFDSADAKENQFFGENDDLKEWNDIFSNDRVDPWDGVDDPWK